MSVGRRNKYKCPASQRIHRKHYSIRLLSKQEIEALQTAASFAVPAAHSDVSDLDKFRSSIMRAEQRTSGNLVINK